MSVRLQLIGLNCRFSHSCLALYYVRHALEVNMPGVEIELEHLTINDPYYETLLKISGCGADVLFFSVYIWNAQYVSRLVHDLTSVDPSRPIVLGGPQAPYLEGLPELCSVVVGEIEGVAEEFYADLEQGILRSKYIAEAGKPFPFPYTDQDFASGLKNRQVYYESSRGCPFRCSYCLSAAGRKVVHKDIGMVRDELGRILAHKPRIIKFVDRTFNDDPDRALQIWKYLAEHGGETRCHFEIAPDRFTDEMFTFLETIGPARFQFEIGIQSTNPETLAAISRTMDVKSAEANVRRLVQLDNIHLHVDLILGLPYETEESYRASFNRVFSLAPHYIQMGLLKVLPDTPIHSQQEEHGLIFCRQPPYEILANRWLDHHALNRLYLLGECIESFYNNRYFSTCWQYLVQQGEEPFSVFTDLLNICEQHGFFDRSPTQELLAEMFSLLANQRPDRELLLDLLRYDWLRCGHRFLPSFLEKFPLAEIRATLRHALPTSIDGLYGPMERSEFLKQGVFVKLLPDAIEFAGMGKKDDAAVVCFLPEQTAGVLKYSRVVVIEGVI